MQQRSPTALHPSQLGPTRKRIHARHVLGILLEQGLSESEAKRRIEADPELREELWADAEQRH